MSAPDEERTYTVTGNQRYKGHKPGETFTAVLTPEQEDRAVKRGSISIGTGDEPKAAKRRKVAPEDHEAATASPEKE